MGFEFSEKADGSYEQAVDSSVVFLFQPDVVLPIEYSERLRRNIHVQSEKRLMLAVLADAVACFQKYHSAPCKKGQTPLREVEEWFCSKDDDWLFSFENICQTLAINSDYFRRGLLKWKEEQRLSQLFGARKGTNRFGEKTRVRRKIEIYRVSAIANHKGDELGTSDTDLQCLGSVDMGTNEQGRSVSKVSDEV